MQETALAGGSVKIVDSTNFNVSTTIAMAEVTVAPGAIRYVSNDINGRGRMLTSATVSFTGTLRRMSGATSCTCRTISCPALYSQKDSEGTGRITLFASSANARTFNFQVSTSLTYFDCKPTTNCLQPGDVGYVPASYGHYVENTGNTTLRFLEIFKSGKSLWLCIFGHLHSPFL